MEITPISSATRTLKVRKPKPTDSSVSKPKVVSVKRKPKTLIIEPPVENLTDMIATAAYFIAQQRNFSPGDEVSDWLMAEQQIMSAHPQA